jgi:hypothetical protein
MTLRVTYKLGQQLIRSSTLNQLVATENLAKNKHILLTVIVKTGHALRFLFGF